MKTFILFLLALSLPASAQDHPTIGKKYTIKYDPRQAGVLVHAKAITLVYVFNVWSTRATSSREPGMLMYNVIHPDSQRVHSAVMEKKGRTWLATIEIPANASLLSYYFKGEDTSDFNHNVTYVSYIYNKGGTPVRDARFRNVAFMNEARKSTIDQLREISGELEDYPDNYISYIPYWMLRFDTTHSTESLQMLRKEMDEKFSQLEKKLGATDTLKNVRAGILYRWGVRLSAAEPGLQKDAFNEYNRIVESILPAKRFRYIQDIYSELNPGSRAVARYHWTIYGLLSLLVLVVALLLLRRVKQRKKSGMH